MGLFGPAWNSKDPQKARAAISKIDNENLLFTVLMTRVDDVGKNVIDRITSEYLLEKIACEYPEAEVRKKMIGKISDVGKLKSISRCDTDPGVRGAAERRVRELEIQKITLITDENELKRTVFTHEDTRVAMFALDKIKSHDLILETVLQGRNAEICNKAFEKISDEAELYRIFKEAKLKEIRMSALDKIIDPELVFKIATEYDDHEVRKQFLSKVKDLAEHTDLAFNSPFGDVKLAVTKTITDQQLLFEIAHKEKITSIRDEAIGKLYDIKLMKQLLDEETDHFERNKLLERVKDLEQNQSVCSGCGKELTMEDLSQCRCGACGKEVHNYKDIVAENVVADEVSHYWYRDLYKICSRCGHKAFDHYIERWGSDTD